jgi:uncharacterized RDD family membrane protein YckC
LTFPGVRGAIAARNPRQEEPMAGQTMSPFSPPKADLEGRPADASGQALARRGTRLAAVFLDGLIAAPGVILAGVAVAATRGGGERGAGFVIGAVLGGLWILALAIVQIYLLSTRGHTLGKRWMKIRIVKLDGSNPGFVSAVLLRAFVNGLISAIPYVGGFYGLVDILFIFRQDQRCLHDLIAGTRVVVA